MKKFLIFLLILSVKVAVGQQVSQNTLYYQNLYLINPAEAGANQQTEFHLSHRQQWLGFEGAPTTTWFSAQSKINDKLSLGTKINYDQISFFEQLQFDASAAYKIKIDASNEINFGLSLGIKQGSLVMENMVATDYSDHILQNNGINGIGFHSEFGLTYSFKKKLAIGLALPQLFSSSIDLEPTTSESSYVFNSHRFFYISYQMDMSEDVTFTPLLLLKRATGYSTQIEFLGNFNFQNKFWGGLGIRQQNGLLVNLGFSPIDNLKMSYAYEFNSNGIAQFSSGTHEIMLAYVIGKKSKENQENLQDLPESQNENKEVD